MAKKYMVAAQSIQQDGKIYKKGEVFSGKVTNQLIEGKSIVEYSEPVETKDSKTKKDNDDLLGGK